MSEVLNPVYDSNPALLLDVDGVFLINRAKARYSSSHGQWLREVCSIATPYYLSLRECSAHEDLRQVLDIPEFDWINYVSLQRKNKSNDEKPKKLGFKELIQEDRKARIAAVEHYLPNRDIIWVDDLMTGLEETWAEKRRAEGLSTLLIKPDGRIGLEPHHMDEAISWLGSLLLGDNVG